MRPRTMISTLVVAVTLMACGKALARTAVYQPLGTWVDPQVETYLRWDASRQAQVARSVSRETRPQLAGLRSKNVELLQDGLRRKFSTKVTTDAIARRHVASLSTTRAGKNVLNGAMAEGIFADRNPDWGYVGKSNASQHDFTQPRPGGGRNNAQVKFHENGNPTKYMQDMKKDWSATKFAVPDDHVGPLRVRLEAEYTKCKAAGDAVGADRAGRNLGRLQGIGATAPEILAARNEAVQRAAQEQYASYVSLGASLALALGPTAWDWMNGSLPANQAMYRSTRALSLLGVGIGTDVALMSVKDGALRGTARGNVIVGTALAITEVTWLLYEHGGRQAFYQPSFYEQVVGGVSSIGLGLAGGVVGTALASETGPWAPVIGFGAGVVTGTVGYIGGRSATHAILQMISPEMLQQQERQQLAAVQSNIERTIATAQKWPPGT